MPNRSYQAIDNYKILVTLVKTFAGIAAKWWLTQQNILAINFCLSNEYGNIAKKETHQPLDNFKMLITWEKVLLGNSLPFLNSNFHTIVLINETITNLTKIFHVIHFF